MSCSLKNARKQTNPLRRNLPPTFSIGSDITGGVDSDFLTCGVCGVEYKLGDIDLFTAHKRTPEKCVPTQDNVLNKNITCAICANSYTSAWMLMQHVQLFHGVSIYEARSSGDEFYEDYEEPVLHIDFGDEEVLADEVLCDDVEPGSPVQDDATPTPKISVPSISQKIRSRRNPITTKRRIGDFVFDFGDSDCPSGGKTMKPDTKLFPKTDGLPAPDPMPSSADTSNTTPKREPKHDSDGYVSGNGSLSPDSKIPTLQQVQFGGIQPMKVAIPAGMMGLLPMASQQFTCSGSQTSPNNTILVSGGVSSANHSQPLPTILFTNANCTGSPGYTYVIPNNMVYNNSPIIVPHAVPQLLTRPLGAETKLMPPPVASMGGLMPPASFTASANIRSLLEGVSLCEKENSGNKPTPLPMIKVKFDKKLMPPLIDRAYPGLAPKKCPSFVKPRAKIDLSKLCMSSLVPQKAKYQYGQLRSCQHCAYKTMDRSNLRRHMRRHTGEKPYKCHHCGYETTQTVSLKAHLRRKHNTDHYQCPQIGCFEQFSMMITLNDHLKQYHKIMKPRNLKKPDLDQVFPSLKQEVPDVKQEYPILKQDYPDIKHEPVLSPLAPQLYIPNVLIPDDSDLQARTSLCSTVVSPDMMVETNNLQPISIVPNPLSGSVPKGVEVVIPQPL